MSAPPKRVLLYIAAVTVPVLALFLRLTLERRYGELPPYLFVYPLVFLVAMWGGVRAGLLVTTASALMVNYWVLPPRGQFKFERTADAVGLAVFCVMGIGISVFAELYHRNRRQLAISQKEQAVLRSEARLHALVNATLDVIYIMSPDWSEMRHLRSQDFLTPTDTPSRTWLQKYIPPEEQGRVMRTIDEAVRTRSKFTLEHRVWRADGTIGWTYSRALPLLDDKGEILEWFGVASETTERRQAQEALLRSEKLAATGRLAATIAHEVNNPLSAAMNAVYIANTNPAQASAMLKLAEQELRRAAHITQRTLGFYRESSGVQQVALPKLVDEVLSVYATKLQNRKISVRCRYGCNSSFHTDGCPEKCEQCEGCLLVHAGEMRQIISNLLANGIDALSDGGVMHVRVSQFSDRIQLTIADDGHGIRTEHLKRIFEPFFTTKETIGTGLGLWVTQELVRKHNGVIKVRSRRDKGTVFRLTFPQGTARERNFSSATSTA